MKLVLLLALNFLLYLHRARQSPLLYLQQPQLHLSLILEEKVKQTLGLTMIRGTISHSLLEDNLKQRIKKAQGTEEEQEKYVYKKEKRREAQVCLAEAQNRRWSHGMCFHGE